MKKGMGKAVSRVNSLTSPMTSVRSPTFRTTTNSRKMATRMEIREDGTTLKILSGSFGRNSITAMLEKQMMSIHMSSRPVFQSCVSGSLKGCSCARPMTIASPLQNPIITGAGRSVMKRDRLRRDTISMSTPANMTEGKSSSTPSPFMPVPALGMNVPMIAANAPVAPFTMAGRPPKREQIKPIIHAACSAIGGLMLAMKAKATDSGICAKQIVRPSRTSRTT
mmetsp:Transcript_14724/g.37749  ORF Transcript_14724/g.37749 Transcript_14724/m.37749 type:complete len:223 (-) Transcript_14724:46-714(-)